MPDDELQTRALSLVTKAREIKVTDKESYEFAGEMVVRLANAEKLVHKECDPVCQATDKAHKDAVALRDRLLNGLNTARRFLRAEMDAWRREQERLAKEKQAILQAEVAQKEQDVVIQQAVAAEAMGDRGAADAILDRPVSAPTIVVKPDVPKVKGVVFRTIWEPLIVNENIIPREYLTPDMEKIRRVVAALKDQANIPGVKAVSRTAGT